jgi:hypothetical protein
MRVKILTLWLKGKIQGDEKQQFSRLRIDRFQQHLFTFLKKRGNFTEINNKKTNKNNDVYKVYSPLGSKYTRL